MPPVARKHRDVPRWQPRIAIIGAGVSGILVAIKLRERGFTAFSVYEKASTLGGTWRDNRYPGIACDVPAHLYVYSFAPSAKWTHRYAGGADIHRYYASMADQYGIADKIRYNIEIALAEWRDGAWKLTTTSGEAIRADIVISAVGRLHHPSQPHIAGLENFAGQIFHSARWPEALSLAGKHVGLIGTGSSATQMTAPLARQVEQLILFQRTPQWVLSMPNPPVKRSRRWLFQLFPESLKTYYRRLEQELAQLTSSLMGGDTAPLEHACRQSLALIRDPELRAKMTPNYTPGCKRLIMSPDFHEAVQRANVAVETAPIDHIEARGVVTEDGRLHELDVLVLATGFKVDAFMRPMTLVGENGITLDHVWADGPMNYRSVAIPHMPNFFMINGPYSPGGSAPVVAIAEVQTGYVLQCVERVVEHRVALAPSPERSAILLAEIRQRALKTVWATGGCKSWYLDKDGIPIYNPLSLQQLSEQLATPDFGDFTETPLETVPA
jgi:cation diffusion facilitator CzcD-associated flavoprotein CzcO